MPMIEATAIAANMDALIAAVVVSVGAPVHVESDEVLYVSVTKSSAAVERLNQSAIPPVQFKKLCKLIKTGS